MTRPEDLLTDALRDRAERGDLAVTPLSDVVSTAGRLRRNRRIRYAAVTTAVVAVLATPFVIDAARPHESTHAPIDTPTTTPAPTVRLANVALGDPPAVPWLDGSDYVAADGTRTTLPVADIVTATPYRGGFLVIAGGEQLHVILLDRQLNEVWRRCGQPVLAVSQDRSSTAYAAGPCRSSTTTLTLGPTDGVGQEQTQTMPLDLAVPVGILGDGVVTSSQIQEQPQLVDFDRPPASIDRLSYVSAVDDRHGLLDGPAPGGPGAQRTGTVIDAVTGTVKWRAPGWQLLSFSPDGSTVVAASADIRSATWAVFDSETGEKLHEFALPTGFRFSGITWEDDDHLLLAAFQGRTEALLRTTLDGAIQLASEPVTYDPDGSDTVPHLAP